MQVRSHFGSSYFDSNYFDSSHIMAPKSKPPNGCKCVVCGTISFQPPTALIDTGHARRLTYCPCGGRLDDEFERPKKKAKEAEAKATEEAEAKATEEAGGKK